MMPNPSINISADQARELIGKGLPLTDFSITGILEIWVGSEWDKEIIMENCILENFCCIMIKFNKRITFKNCHFKDAVFNFSYFLDGLLIDNCRFEKYLDFEGGGHNEVGKLYSIMNSEFIEFVNFNDCWFTGDVAISNNIFHRGTNIGSKEQHITLDGKLLLENNVGKTEIDDDCRLE